MKSRIAAFAVMSRPMVSSSRNSTLGSMQEARRDLTSHALAERQLLHWSVQYLGKTKALRQFCPPRPHAYNLPANAPSLHAPNRASA
jgi:hypothetical protein